MKAKKGLWVLLLVIMLAVFAVSAYKVVSHLLDRSASQHFQEELIDQMVTVVSEAKDQDALTAQLTLLQGEAVSSYALETGGIHAQSSEMPLQAPLAQCEVQQDMREQTASEAVVKSKNEAFVVDSVPAKNLHEMEPAQSLYAEFKTGEPFASGIISTTENAEESALDDEITAQTQNDQISREQLNGAIPSDTVPEAEVFPENISVPEPSASPAPAATSAPTAENIIIPMPTPSETAPISVDFDKLTSKYKDVVCWIYLPGSPVNYAVAQGKDNTEYLRKMLSGGYSYSGSIFMDSMNAPDFSDWNTILYGHNMKNGSMFGYIPYFAVQQYYEQHPYLYLLTPDQDYKVDLFAGYVTTPDSDAYLIAQTMQERDDIIAEALSMTTFQADVEIGPEDRIVTLSTCTYAYDNARYVLLGVLRPLAPQME